MHDRLNEVLAVAFGGAVGAVARYFVFVTALALFGPNFPYGTLFVNIVGSFLLGVLVEAMALVWSPSLPTRLFMVVGILGAFTTFSTFSLDVAVLYERGRLLATGGYVLSSFVFSVSALFAGLYIMRRILAPGV